MEEQGQAVGTASSAAVAATMVVSGVSAISSGGSPQSMFSAVNQFQLLLLFPLFDFYLPTLVVSFYESLDWTLFSFDFIDTDKIPLLQDLKIELELLIFPKNLGINSELLTKMM